MNVDIQPLIDNWQMYLSGFSMTIFLTVTALSIGMLLAIVFSVIKDGSNRWLIWLVNGIVFYFRGTPCLIQIYLIYYGLAQFEWINDTVLWVLFSEPVFCVMLALTLNTAAYTTEIIYGGITATPKGEVEAAIAFGYSRMMRLRYIIFPSLIRRIIPIYANESVFLMQATALASTITVVELTQVARLMNSRFFIPFEAFIFAALFYMLTSYLIFWSMNKLEQKLSAHKMESKT